jgi:putative DNA primase/helicase
MEKELHKVPYTLDLLPAELRDAKLWLVWRLEDSDTRERCKVPKIPANLSVGASSTNPEHWTTLPEAQAALAKLKPLPKYASDYSTGVGCVVANGYVGVDLDHCYEEASATLDDFAKQFIASVPPTYLELTPTRSGLHLWYRLASGVRPPAKQGIRTKRAELYLSGRYLTVTGWRNGELQTIHELTQAELDALIAAVEVTREAKTANAVRPYSSEKFNDYMTRHDFADLSTAVHGLVVMLLRKHKLDRAAAEAEFKKSAIYEHTHWREKWGRLGKDEMEKCEPLAKEWLERDARRMQACAEKFNHEAGGNEIAERFGATIKYDHSVKRWRKYLDGVWVEDEIGSVYQLFDQIINDARQLLLTASGADLKNLAAYVNALSNYDNREKSFKWASTRPGIATKLTDYDANPYLLNCVNGVYDLESLKFRDHQASDLFIRQTGAPFDASAEYPLWRSTLDLFLPDKEVQNLVQEYSGVSLTGLGIWKNILAAIGDTDCGKSTIGNTIAYVLGTYAGKLSFKSIAPNKNQNDPELVDVCGARFVAVGEGDKHQKIHTSLLKLISSGAGDAITVARKYQNPITYVPSYRLWLMSNFSLDVDSDDDAAWNRILKVPFEVRISADKIDRSFPEKLKAEASGILNWMIDGWKRVASRSNKDLLIPESVRVATRKSREDNDRIRTWFDDQYVITNVDSDRLFTNVAWNNFQSYYRDYRDEQLPKSQSALTAELAKRVIRRKAEHAMHGNYFSGVKPRQAEIQMNDPGL